MKLSRRAWAIVAAGLVLFAGAWWFGLVRQNYDVALTSRSMSHADENLPGVMDPGEKVSVTPVARRSDVVTFVEARDKGPRVGDEWGDVITFRARQDGVRTDHGIVHRAMAWLEYNATADAYDVPDLGLRGVRTFTVPGVGTWDPFAQEYRHAEELVMLDPDAAGRHDGFLTKGDHNVGFDQDLRGELQGVGDVELVPVGDVDGKVADWLEPHEATRTAWWAFGGALVLAVGVVIGRRTLRGRMPSLAGARGCRSCGKRYDEGEPFCPACGALREPK